MNQSQPKNGSVVPATTGLASNSKHRDGEQSANTMAQNADLQSGILFSPADAMLGRAISETLMAPASDRAWLFEHWVREIENYMAAHPQERPWTCVVYTGTDGSRIFRGGVGHSLVIDPEGRLWRARSYEDFETTYRFSGDSCEIATLT
ncbi:MAG TPA: hypothetical protein VFV34_26520, partial [Blastocatellia bacterium]|nr:hypothetical protein [Blastocatellia bacterium]